jgi:uncharacterized protein DUF1707
MSDELRASDSDREQAVARLREASAEGRLTLDELVARTGAALEARTHADLERVTADLPATTSGQPPARTQRARLVLALFAPVRRRSRWRLGRQTVVVSAFAPTVFDLGSATLESEEATITVFSIFAPVTVTAPAHVDVDCGVVSIFAPFQELGSLGELRPGAPRVRINGVTLFAPFFLRYKQ